MFDVGFSELLMIGVVALIVLGPERLPRAARMAGLWMRRARAQWYSLQTEMEQQLAAEDLRRSLREAQEAAAGVQAQVRDAVAEGQHLARSAAVEITDASLHVGESRSDATDSPRDAAP